MISLFSFLHTGMVIVQFRGRLVRQYRACVVDSLGVGITCVLYYHVIVLIEISKAVYHPLCSIVLTVFGIAMYTYVYVYVYIYRY